VVTGINNVSVKLNTSDLVDKLKIVKAKRLFTMTTGECYFKMQCNLKRRQYKHEGGQDNLYSYVMCYDK